MFENVRPWARRCALLALATTGLVLATAALAFAATTGQVALTLPSWDSSYAWSEEDGYNGWQSHAGGLDPFGYGFAEGLGGRSGLWLWLSGGREYRPGSREYVLEAPGTTRIASADLTLSYADKLFAHHCLAIGVRSSTELRASDDHCSPPTDNRRYQVMLSDPSGAPTSKQVYVRVEMPVCHNPADNPCSKHVPALDPLKNGPFVRVESARLVLVDDDDPTIGATGALADLAGRYIDGSASYQGTLAASDPGSGVSRVNVELAGERGVAADAAPCDPHHRTPALGAALCPPDYSLGATLDTRDLAEGRHVLAGWATDLAGNSGTTEPWAFFVDRTPPAKPQPAFETDEGSVQTTWDDVTDPALADGQSGSGLAGYEVRHRIDGGDWSTWESLDPDEPQGSALDGLPGGITVDFEVVSIDAVGNRSEAALASGVVEAPPADVDGIGLIKASDEVLTQQGKETDTGCSFPDAGSLTLKPDQYGVYEDVVDVSLGNCTRTLDRGTIEPATSPEDEAQRLRFLGIKGDAIPPAAEAHGVRESDDDPAVARTAQATTAKETEVRYVQVVRAGLAVGFGLPQIGFQQWKTITALRWAYNWHGDNSGVGYFGPWPPNPFAAARTSDTWRASVNPRRLFGWSSTATAVSTKSDNMLELRLDAHGKAKAGKAYKTLAKKLLEKRFPGWAVDLVFKIVDSSGGCRVHIDEPHHDMKAMGDGSLVENKSNPSTSYRGGLVGVCRLANLIKDASPVKLYHEKMVVRPYNVYLRPF